ncbi:hypothetical protein D3C80_1214130 [compost metagenome]
MTLRWREGGAGGRARSAARRAVDRANGRREPWSRLRCCAAVCVRRAGRRLSMRSCCQPSLFIIGEGTFLAGKRRWPSWVRCEYIRAYFPYVLAEKLDGYAKTHNAAAAELGRLAFLPRSCPCSHRQRCGPTPGSGLHHRVAAHPCPGAVPGRPAVREIANLRFRPDRGRAASGQPRRKPGKYAAGGLRAGFRHHRGALRASAHWLHGSLRNLFHHGTDEPLPRALPEYFGGHFAGPALHQPVTARGGYRHHPGAARTRSIRVLATVRLPPAPVCDAGVPGQSSVDRLS